MQQLPWKLVSVPADGRCALHATAAACAYSGTQIKRELLLYYKNTPAEELIRDLIESGDFMKNKEIQEFGESHVANPLYFKDFILEKSEWIDEVFASECEDADQICLSSRRTCPHSKVVSFVHKKSGRRQTTMAVLRRNAVIFLNCSRHWYVLMPYEKTLPLFPRYHVSPYFNAIL
jgi:hypothetical protein